MAYFFFVNAKLAYPENLYNFATLENRVFGHISYVEPAHSYISAIHFAKMFIINLNKFVPEFNLINERTDEALIFEQKLSPSQLMKSAGGPLHSKVKPHDVASITEDNKHPVRVIM